MLETSIQLQLKTYLDRLIHPIELIASLDLTEGSEKLRQLLMEISRLCPLVQFREDGNQKRKPSFSVARAGELPRIHFAGLPMGQEFNSLVLALLHVGGHPPKLEAAVIEQIRAIPDDLYFETYISLSCHNCPDIVQALNVMAALNPRIHSVMIDGALWNEEVQTRNIMAVPSVFLNDTLWAQGRMSLAEILTKVDKASATQKSEKINQKAPFDVLIVGGGPAGASAALYAARKGIRTGLVAERFGGQVLDTLSIENLVSVKRTEGLKLATALEEHVRNYDVDIMNLQRIESLDRADESGLMQLRTAEGARLWAKSVILAPGARWREMGVPGEQKYKARGVCFCPHCDGPLFKGKRVAVIGGGNSGVEAAIDLAGLVQHVTLIELNERLLADAVLQAKLKTLVNVTILTKAKTVEVVGDGQKVTGLLYEDLMSGSRRTIPLEGIFVQIGLLPNTDWLKGVLDLSARGEIEVDSRGQTSMPGVFAAGDATTVAYKQIIIAMGQGASAALGAFDYLIRRPIDSMALLGKAA